MSFIGVGKIRKRQAFYILSEGKNPLPNLPKNKTVGLIPHPTSWMQLDPSCERKIKTIFHPLKIMEVQKMIVEELEEKKKQIRTRNKLVNFRVTESEFEKLESKIEKSKLSKQEYLLKATLEKDIIVIENIRELTLELKKVGNNINQIARAVHTKDVSDSSELRKIESQYNQLFDELIRVLKKV